MTNYTQWKSLVDLQEYSAIPDSVVDHLDIWYPIDEGSGNPQDQLETASDLTLSGPSWDENGYWNDWAILLDGTDDTYISDSTIDVGDELSFCAWYEHESDGMVTAFGDDGIENGPVLLDRDGSIRIRWREGDSTAGPSGTPNIDSQDDRVFVGGTVSETTGDINIYVWTETQFVGSDSANDDNSDEDIVLPQGYIQSIDFGGDYFGGPIDALGYGTDTVLSESDFGDIWEDTRP